MNSFSFTGSGGVHQVKVDLMATYASNPLDVRLQNLRHKIENMLSDIENGTKDKDFPVNVVSSGSQTVDGSGKVTAVSLNLSIT